MESMLKLTTQNPLSLLVKFGIMAWNGTCADNCSGHGECHNGTCLCEVGHKNKREKNLVNINVTICLKLGLLVLLLALGTVNVIMKGQM
jgi:hypothetical protein